jgi:hypothetical protein
MSAAIPGGSAGSSPIDTAAIDRFAVEFRKEQQGNWLYAERLGGFCLLLKREVLAKIGIDSPLSPPGRGAGGEGWTDLSLFDTDILSAKATQAGYSLAVCRDLFVHHFGTRTFAHGPTTASPS